MARWEEGLPDYLAVPGHIHLKEILRLWTYVKGLDLVEWGKMRYNLMSQGDHWFPGETAGKVDELDLAAALKGSPFKDRIPGMLREAHDLLSDAPRKRLSQR